MSLFSRKYWIDDPCRDCETPIDEKGDISTGRCATCQAKADRRNAKAKARRAAMSDAMDSVGMKRVRGNLGGTFYE